MKLKMVIFFSMLVKLRQCVLLLALLLATLLSCRKKNAGPSFSTYTCPAFLDPFFDTWFPYASAQIIRFKNTAGTEEIITIRQVSKSKESTFTIPIPSNVDPAPCPQAFIAATKVDSPAVYFSINYYPLSDGNGHLQLQLKRTYLYATAIKDTGLVIVSTNSTGSVNSKFNTSKFHVSYTINNVSFSNVQIITRDTTTDHTNDVYKIVLSKTKGIIGFEEYPSLSLWTLQ